MRQEQQLPFILAFISQTVACHDIARVIIEYLYPGTDDKHGTYQVLLRRNSGGCLSRDTFKSFRLFVPGGSISLYEQLSSGMLKTFRCLVLDCPRSKDLIDLEWLISEELKKYKNHNGCRFIDEKHKNIVMLYNMWVKLKSKHKYLLGEMPK